MTDYVHGNMYKLLSTATTDMCIGSTRQTLSKRMDVHRSASRSHAKAHYLLYQKIRGASPSKAQRMLGSLSSTVKVSWVWVESMAKSCTKISALQGGSKVGLESSPTKTSGRVVISKLKPQPRRKLQKYLRCSVGSEKGSSVYFSLWVAVNPEKFG